MHSSLWLGPLSVLLALSSASVRGDAINVTSNGNADDLLAQAADLLHQTTPPTTGATSSPNANANANAPASYVPMDTTDPVQITDSMLVYMQSYTSSPPDSIRNLRDNTANTEAVVQSSKDSGAATSQADAFPSPITVEPPQIQTARRRLGSGDEAPLSVMFCDPSGNAIWKWDYFAPAVSNTTTAPPTSKTTTTTTTNRDGFCDARTTVKVSAFQAGCSLQNHPEGCGNVLYKGCGGLTVHPDSKRVVVARTGGRSLGVLDYKSKGGSCQGRTVDALATFKGRKFNSPSDAEFAANGDLFITDSPFGLAKKESDFDDDSLDASPLREIPFNGVYRLRNQSRSVELVDCTMDRPNKIAFSPKQDVLYVTNSRKTNSYVKQFPLYQNGTIGTPSVFFNFTAHPELETEGGFANGIKVDDEGHVFVVAFKGVFVFSNTSELLVAIRSNQELSGVSLGADRLFYTGAFGVASQGGVNFSTVAQAYTDCQAINQQVTRGRTRVQ